MMLLTSIDLVEHNIQVSKAQQNNAGGKKEAWREI